MLSKLIAGLQKWSGVFALFLLLTGGIAYAANTIGSADVIDNSLRSVDLKTDQGVKGVDVVPDSLTGADVNESTLQGVDAGSVSGIEVRKIRFDVPYGTGPTVVLDFKGLKIAAECQNFGDYLDVKATTTKDLASAYLFGVGTAGPDDSDAFRDIGGTQYYGGTFDTPDVINVDNQIPKPTSVPHGIATLHYEAPDGSVVVVELALTGTNTTNGCTLTGMAFGG
jgi:hypothetical protein